jgi:L-rhamnose 1-dehydrogenase
MAYLLSGKVAAITGGVTGIGRSIALEYIQQGCNVAVNHLGQEKDAQDLASLLATAKELKEADPKAGDLIELPGDVSEPETGKILVDTTVEKWGRLDIFVSNAGICAFRPFLE